MYHRIVILLDPFEDARESQNLEGLRSQISVSTPQILKSRVCGVVSIMNSLMCYDY